MDNPQLGRFFGVRAKWTTLNPGAFSASVNIRAQESNSPVVERLDKGLQTTVWSPRVESLFRTLTRPPWPERVATYFPVCVFQAQMSPEVAPP
eukprot:8369382-Pyramimonas_sp.AAC.1